jgi:hypothetical protein
MAENNNEQEANNNQVQHEQIINQGVDYEPSPTLKRAYLSLRKKPRVWGQVKYPGLFDYDPANDFGWFVGTVILELVSLFTTYFILEERISTAVLIMGVVILFVLDFVAAYFHHKYKTFRCDISNQQRLFLAEMRPTAKPFAKYYSGLEQEIKDKNLGLYFWTGFICLLAVLKAIIFLAGIPGAYWFKEMLEQSKAPLLLLVAGPGAYAWIAYNHLNFTGYFFAHFAHSKKYKSEFAEYNRQANQLNIEEIKNKKQTQEQLINLKQVIEAISTDLTNPFLAHFAQMPKVKLEQDLNTGIREITQQTFPHEIPPFPHSFRKTEQQHVYSMRRYGLLTDDQLEKMVNEQQTPLAKIIVAMYGHYLQIQSGQFYN